LVKYQQVPDAPLTRDEAKEALNRCLRDGDVSYTRHFRDELLNDDLDMGDILRACQSGAIHMAPEKDIKTGHWKYRIEGRTADGRRIAIVFAFKSELAVFITAFEKWQ
jgi:hypothetical protein